MFKYKNEVLNVRTDLVNAFSQIYGIGVSKGKHVTDSLGFCSNFKLCDLNHYYFSFFVLLFKERLVLDMRLKELVLQRLEFFYSKGFIRGFRVFDGLPIRGRTHSNGASAFRMKPFSEKYNEDILNRKKRVK